MEASVKVIFHFEEDSFPCHVPKSTIVETLKFVVCDRWTVLNPWSVRFVLKGQCNQLYVDSDFVLQSVFERFFMRSVATFNLFCERFVYSPSHTSPSSCQNPIPGTRVVSPVSKDARAKKFFEGSQAGVKPKKNKLWEQAITGVGQIFYNGVQEVRNVVAMVCFENGHEPDNKKRKSEPYRYTVRCKNWKTAGCLWEFHAKSITKDNKNFEVMRYHKDHTCGAGYRESKVCVPAKFVKQVINEQVRNNPLISPKKIVGDFKLPVHGDDQLYPHALNHWRNAVYALTEGGYNKAVKDIIDLGCGHVVRWMEKQGPEHWSNAFFEGCRYGNVSSSVDEYVNNWLKDEKRMPVSALVNTIRLKMMEMISKRHKISETMTSRLTPQYESKLKELTDEGNSWNVIPAGNTLFEVVADHRYAVNLDTFHCSCNMWKVYGFPCSHAIQCILLSGKQVYDFVQPYFTSSWYKTLYSFAIHPVPDFEKENEISNDVRVIPPPVKKNPGRPKTERFLPMSVKMKNEKRKIRCGNCKRLSNHNSRTCPYQEVHDFSGI
ncbi:hypothetical protein MKW92_007451 [Papaver armeniacum]|nr:hypothetical protein MKW92_007451 [Papaver armeniacum]